MGKVIYPVSKAGSATRYNSHYCKDDRPEHTETVRRIISDKDAMTALINNGNKSALQGVEYTG